MALTLEWKDRIYHWYEELPRHFYRPLGTMALEGFVTLEQLTPAAAAARDFLPMPPGVAWGAKWEYGWFKGSFVLPDAAAEQRIVLAVDVGAESIVFVNGVAAGARDRQHSEITLALEGIPGTRYDVLAEGYAGHGPRNSHAGPTPLDRETVPEPGPTQAVVGQTTFGVWQEEVYQLWVDVMTLWQLRENLDENSLRRDGDRCRTARLHVDRGLRGSRSRDAGDASTRAASGSSRCWTASTARRRPEMFAFGHSHIDVAWLWPLQETERKAGRTMATQLALMAEYPEYKFLQSQPHLFWMLQQRYPDLYARIKDAAQAGQFIVEGGTWVEPDTNISGGEALIRQFIHGKRFYKDEFGVDCELLWLPDVFGYSGALPQIMRGCGVKYFSTQKIFWAYHGGDPFPLQHLHLGGYRRLRSLRPPAQRLQCARRSEQRHPTLERARAEGRLCHAAVPVRLWRRRWRPNAQSSGIRPPSQESGRRAEVHDCASPRLLQGSGGASARLWPDARYVGELYFQAHRGVLTSQAKTKQGNRKSELALREAEFWGVAARR